MKPLREYLMNLMNLIIATNEFCKSNDSNFDVKILDWIKTAYPLSLPYPSFAGPYFSLAFLSPSSPSPGPLISVSLLTSDPPSPTARHFPSFAGPLLSFYSPASPNLLQTPSILL